MHGPRVYSVLVVALGILLPSWAVAGAWKLEVKPLPEDPTRGKLPIRVTLLLAEECCGLVKEISFLEKRKVALGEVLCGYAEEVARAAFADFIRRGEATRPEAGTEAVLRLRFVDISWSSGMSAWSQQEVLILIEWMVLDREGKTLWAQTIRGVARGKLGTLFSVSRRNRELLQAAVDDVFNQSLKQMISSPELRRLAK
jgi:hypothetical protein